MIEGHSYRDVDGGGVGGVPEEARDYLDFLKSDLSAGIEAVLEKTLFGVQTDLEDIAAETFAELMEIRERIVGRTRELQKSGGNPRQQKMMEVFSQEMMKITVEAEWNTRGPRFRYINKDTVIGGQAQK